MEAQNSISLSDITNLLESGALLRCLGRWHLIWGPFKVSKEPISHDISMFCPAFYDSENTNYLSGSRYATLSSELLSDLLGSFLQEQAIQASENKLKTVIWQEPTLECYAQFFNDVQVKIQNKEIIKAVPVVFAKTRAKVSSIERARMLLELIQSPTTLYVYGYWDHESGILGATPEILFHSKNLKIQTMALAGTCPKSDSAPRASLLEDPKERHEHDLVIQDITQVLSAYGSVQKSETQLLELPTLWHLKTDLSVLATDQLNFTELVKKLHPTPALGVFPRTAGYHWMQNYEDQNARARFGAPFMFVFPDKNEAICLVAIRNLQWNGDEILLGSGAGVVAASQLDREWQELLQKRESVKKILGI